MPAGAQLSHVPRVTNALVLIDGRVQFSRGPKSKPWAETGPLWLKHRLPLFVQQILQGFLVWRTNKRLKQKLMMVFGFTGLDSAVTMFYTSVRNHNLCAET